MLIKKFRASVIGANISTKVGENIFPDGKITFTRSKIVLTFSQYGRIYTGASVTNTIRNGDKYKFKKGYNSDDEMKYTVIIKDASFDLALSSWDKMKANIIHHRYWVYREKDWFLKTILTVIITFLVSLIGIYLGYRQGHASGIKEMPSLNQRPIR